MTGITAYLSGADSATVNQTTATGVSALQGAANTLLRFKAAQLHGKGWQRTYEQWGEMIQQFLDKETWVKITDEKGDAQWHAISPQDVVGSFHYKLEGSEEALTQQQERNEAVGLLNALTPLILNGKVNGDPIIERIALSFGVTDPSSLIAPPPQLPTGPQQNGQQAAGQLPQLLQNGQSMPLQVQGAITGGR